MKKTNNYESRLWGLLEEGKLADLSQFHQPGFFDEVPLYARESQIGFLPADEQTANEILLRFALKFLTSVVAYEKHRKGYFAAITLWTAPAGPLVPNLFVWSGPVRGLKAKLALHAVRDPFGKQIKKLVQKAHLGEPFDVYEDSSTVAETARVFIAPAHAPYRGFAVLDTFRRPVEPQKRRSLRA